MKPIVIYDGDCALCHKSVNFLLRHDSEGQFRFASNGSPAGRRLLEVHGIVPEDVESVYLVEGREIYGRSDATLRIARRLKSPWRWLSGFRFVPRPLRDLGYKLVARTRYKFFGKAESCRLPTAEERSRMVVEVEDVEPEALARVS